jgi:hypothetical protein
MQGGQSTAANAARRVLAAFDAIARLTLVKSLAVGVDGPVMSSWGQVGRATPRLRRRGADVRARSAASARGVAALYGVAVFVAAFLLFQVEPIMGRLILPWFGGSAAIWMVAILFFQVVLVLGYLYAHLLVRHVSPARQMFVHVPVLLASLAVLPILPAASWRPVGGQDPTLRILGLLAVTVGPPFFVLCTCGPLLQAWYARGHGRPYRLFSLSNGASLLALLSYPLIVEPRLGLHAQAYVWSSAYALFVALAIAITVRAGLAARRAASVAETRARTSAPRWLDRVRWLALATTPSLLTLAVTNHLTRNVAPIPLLWVLPLSVYLLSLIICFESDQGYRRALFLPLLPVVLFLVAAGLFPGELEVGIIGQIAFFTGALFVFCMVCHGELARLKPAPDHLTGFYVMVAVGGALGGLFVAVLSPEIFSDYFELAFGIVLCAVVVLVAVAGDLLKRTPGRVWPRRAVALVLAAATVLLGTYVLGKVLVYDRGDRLVARDFYGVSSVRDSAGSEAVRTLYSGAIVHGEQLLAPGGARTPISYYGSSSGLGVLMREENRTPQPTRVGVIGLGAGTIAAFGRPGDSYRFYEIDPLDISIAKTWFSFLRDSPAHVKVISGDARLSLEREPSQHFNVLVADAFNGDAVPIQLMTLQAFRLYFSQLAPGGVLAVNVSNRFLNLAPVVARAAGALDKQAIRIEVPGETTERIYKRSDWVLVTGNRQLAAKLAHTPHSELLNPNTGIRLWTDDYSNVLASLKALQ